MGECFSKRTNKKGACPFFSNYSIPSSAKLKYPSPETIRWSIMVISSKIPPFLILCVRLISSGDGFSFATGMVMCQDDGKSI